MDLVGFVVVSLFEATVEKSPIGASVEKSPNGASVEKSSIRGCRAAGPEAFSEFGVAASSEADGDSVGWRCGPLVEVKRLKHSKNCECCPGHYMIVNHYSSI